jgi:3-oxoacyl-[acyl-carrier protein] reductase
VLVTGASRGLGASIAVAFAAEGAHVGVGFRANDQDAARVAANAVAAGGTAVLVAIDVRNAAHTNEAVSAFASPNGIHVLVNNAGVARDQFFPLLTNADWCDVIDTNLSGVYHVSRAALPHLLRSKGSIVNIGSVAGIRASPAQANYAAAKGGLLALTSTMAAEFAPRGVRVNAVVPGLLSTGMGARLGHRIVEQDRAAIPLGRLGTGEEVARVVLFLASADASYIVGQAVVADGGMSL